MLRSSTNKSITCFHLGRAGQLPRNSDSWRWPLVTTWSKCSCWLRWTTESGFDNYWVCRKHMGSPYSREFTTRHGWFNIRLNGFKCWFPHSTMFGEQTQVPWLTVFNTCFLMPDTIDPHFWNPSMFLHADDLTRSSLANLVIAGDLAVLASLPGVVAIAKPKRSSRSWRPSVWTRNRNDGT